ncbi:hypothetical protein LCGC14_1858050 [marine sediment metagenome]|uniref:Uncharacterized protein n=1 Tax=marine sediment metagenome TaxID=412755 RepID=A0A0F9G8A3_9ZZZZ
MEQDYKDYLKRELQKERDTIKILQERMDRGKRGTRDWRDLRLSQEQHQRELGDLEHTLINNGVDIK